MFLRMVAVMAGGLIVWAVLKWAEEAVGDRAGAIFRLLGVVLVVLVFAVEFMLVTGIPNTAKSVIYDEYAPSSYQPNDR